MTNFNESVFINNLHKAYLDRISIYHAPDGELTRFSWTENKTVTIYLFMLLKYLTLIQDINSLLYILQSRIMIRRIN